MSPRPAIFISAVSQELSSARQLVANTLIFLGYDPEWQDIFATEEGDLRAMLRRRIDSCKAVVQLVGQCYGTEPPSVDEKFGRVSYTQYEALYAASTKKKVWYLFVDETFPTDPHDQESEERRKLQDHYRARLKADSHLYHPLATREGLEASVLKLRDDLARLRRGVRRWAACVTAFLVLSVALSIWLLHNQQHSDEQLQALQIKFEKLQEGVNSFAEVQYKVRQEQPGEKAEELEQRTYEALGKQLGLDSATLKEQLPRFAQELRKAPNATTYERANAAYVAKDYLEAERLALAAADEAERASPPKNADAIKAFELAAWAAEKRLEYADAAKRLRDAEQMTDRARDVLEWARVQFAIAWVRDDQGQYRDSERILREVLKERQRVLGPEHSDTLATMGRLADELFYQGKYVEAEAAYRAVLPLQEKVLGPECAETLVTRSGLASALCQQGKYAEAEVDLRAVLQLEEKLLGLEHRGTRETRNNLAGALYAEGKYAEAETEFRMDVQLKEKTLGPEDPETFEAHTNLGITLASEGKYAEAEAEDRTVIKLEEKVVGPEHPDTLNTRNNLGDLLDLEGRYAEAEAEDRALIKLETKVLGPEHPGTLEARCNLTKALAHQGKYIEAETEARAVIELREKVLGPEHPDTLRTCFELAVCLRAQSEIQQATAFAQRAVDGARKALGPEHPDTKEYQNLLTELQEKEH